MKQAKETIMGTVAKYDAHNNILHIEQDGHLVKGYIGKVAERKFAEILTDDSFDGITMLSCLNDDGERKRLIKRVHAIVTARGINPEYYRDLLEQFNVETSTDLSLDELRELVAILQPQQLSPVIAQRRRVIMGLCKSIGVCFGGDYGWDNLNKFLRHKRIAGKELYRMTADELADCEIKLRAILHHQNRRAES